MPLLLLHLSHFASTPPAPTGALLTATLHELQKKPNATLAQGLTDRAPIVWNTKLPFVPLQMSLGRKNYKRCFHRHTFLPPHRMIPCLLPPHVGGGRWPQGVLSTQFSALPFRERERTRRLARPPARAMAELMPRTKRSELHGPSGTRGPKETWGGG